MPSCSNIGASVVVVVDVVVVVVVVVTAASSADAAVVVVVVLVVLANKNKRNTAAKYLVITPVILGGNPLRSETIYQCYIWSIYWLYFNISVFASVNISVGPLQRDCPRSPQQAPPPLLFTRGHSMTTACLPSSPKKGKIFQCL